MSDEPFRTALLLSMPQMQDPNFSRTVVLLCEYSPEGAFGLVINRPTDMPASTMVRLEPPIVDGNTMPLFIGGPPEPPRGWILLSGAPPPPGGKLISAGFLLSSPLVVLGPALPSQPAP